MRPLSRRVFTSRSGGPLFFALASLLPGLALTGGTAALAHSPAREDSVCPPPEITHTYDTDQLAVQVKLAATGCRAREHTMFGMSAHLGRFDEHGPLESVEKTVMCGPFPSAADRAPDEAPVEYFCDLDVALAHPDVETVHYDIDVGYPGSTSARNRTVILACSSDGEVASCDE
jgi:hypothetical protein